jgi:hypothetical protein
MDWFERLTGFQEQYESTRSLLELEGEFLRSKVNSKKYRAGRLGLPQLAEFRSRVADVPRNGKLDFATIRGDARSLHRSREDHGALFQVASQFNLLEMVGPHVSPEDGVTGYQWDHTQGPACAISAGAATLYRNYFVPVAGELGQSSKRQLDTLADVGALLSTHTGIPADGLWTMTNGYPIAGQSSVDTFGSWLRAAGERERDEVRSRLRVGVHRDVEVTDRPEVDGSVVSQVFCSAIPVSYSQIAAAIWEPFGRIVLEAAYEATLSAAVLNAAQGSSRTAYLTRLGGGAFGNPREWIDDALQRALDLFSGYDLRVRLVEYGISPR